MHAAALALANGLQFTKANALFPTLAPPEFAMAFGELVGILELFGLGCFSFHGFYFLFWFWFKWRLPGNRTRPGYHPVHTMWPQP
jgi:hypothetical protein